MAGNFKFLYAGKSVGSSREGEKNPKADCLGGRGRCRVIEGLQL